MKNQSHGASRPTLPLPVLLLHTLTMDFYKLPSGLIQQVTKGEKAKFISEREFTDIKAVFGR